MNFDTRLSDSLIFRLYDSYDYKINTIFQILPIKYTSFFKRVQRNETFWYVFSEKKKTFGRIGE